jgi:hypothetical protein
MPNKSSGFDDDDICNDICDKEQEKTFYYFDTDRFHQNCPLTFADPNIATHLNRERKSHNESIEPKFFFTFFYIEQGSDISQNI